MKCFENFKNIIDFFLRQNLTFSRKNYFEKNEPKEDLFSAENVIADEQKLSECFDLSYLKNSTTRQNYLENLYLLDILNKFLPQEKREDLKVLDIGCKNWFYAKGEYFFFKKYCEKLILDGIEIDANRLYSNFYTRGEVAKFYTKGLKNANYIANDFMKHNEKYDCIVWILPFVIEEPMLKWGLPTNYFKPIEMLKHAFDSLNENGKMIIFNQGETEYNVQKSLCEKLNINYKELGEVKSDFLDYKTRYGILVEK